MKFIVIAFTGIYLYAGICTILEFNLRKVKKLVAIFFLIVYTATAFGVVVNVHHCDQVLSKISISDLNGKCTCDGHSFMTKDCCKNKI